MLASLEVAETFAARSRGLIGRSPPEGAMLIRHARGVHSIGMRFAIDVAFLDGELVVLDWVTVKPYRASFPRIRARSVLEAEAGAFERWGLQVGDRLEIKE